MTRRKNKEPATGPAIIPATDKYAIRSSDGKSWLIAYDLKAGHWVVWDATFPRGALLGYGASAAEAFKVALKEA